MPNYNNGKYIREALNSVIWQTYTNWEVIIVDDASTDNSKEIYKEYKSYPQIRVYFNDVNSGAGFTYHQCLEYAKGEICAILDPDDILASNKAIETMVAYHLFYKDSGVICSRHNFCNENMKLLWVSEIRDKNENLVYLTDQEHNTEHFITFKKSESDKVGGINPNYKNAIDQEFLYRMEEVTKITFVDDILYNYRLVSTGLTLQSNNALYWHTKAIVEACERRGLNPDMPIGKLFDQVVKPHKEKYERVMNSSFYKFGKFVLEPFYCLKAKLFR